MKYIKIDPCIHLSFVLVNVVDVYLYLFALRHSTVLFKDCADDLSFLSASLHSLP